MSSSEPAGRGGTKATSTLSIQAQTYENWRLWIRDDGSEDDTAHIIDKLSEADPRIRLRILDGARMGRPRSFSTLLEALPENARLIFTADADDHWVPNKIEVLLNGMINAEREAPGPILVHTGLAVATPDSGCCKARSGHSSTSSPNRDDAKANHGPEPRHGPNRAW